jgi:hydrogenase nickel incorporation protein HypA/HybF
MYERSLTRDIVDICEKSTAGMKVISVTLEVGELSGITPGAIQFCFDECARGTSVEGAPLRVERIEAKCRCQECAAEFPLRGFHGSCPTCGGDRMEIISGDEMKVKYLEVA